MNAVEFRRDLGLQLERNLLAHALDPEAIFPDDDDDDDDGVRDL